MGGELLLLTWAMSWQISPTAASRFYPHRFLPEYDASLYVDGNIDIIRDPLGLFEKYSDRNICAIKHHKRSCAYEEGRAILAGNRLKESEKLRLKDQLNRYESEGFPGSYGLSENFVLLRFNNEDVNNLMELWWDEFQAGAPRDQFCLSYAMWKFNKTMCYMDESPRGRQEYFSIRLHKRESQMSPLRRLGEISSARKYQNMGYRLISILYGLIGKISKAFN